MLKNITDDRKLQTSGDKKTKTKKKNQAFLVGTHTAQQHI